LKIIPKISPFDGKEIEAAALAKRALDSAA
jgi:hypothetical protein